MRESAGQELTSYRVQVQQQRLMTSLADVGACEANNVQAPVEVAMYWDEQVVPAENVLALKRSIEGVSAQDLPNVQLKESN